MDRNSSGEVHSDPTLDSPAHGKFSGLPTATAEELCGTEYYAKARSVHLRNVVSRSVTGVAARALPGLATWMRSEPPFARSVIKPKSTGASQPDKFSWCLGKPHPGAARPPGQAHSGLQPCLPVAGMRGQRQPLAWQPSSLLCSLPFL